VLESQKTLSNGLKEDFINMARRQQEQDEISYREREKENEYQRENVIRREKEKQELEQSKIRKRKEEDDLNKVKNQLRDSELNNIELNNIISSFLFIYLFYLVLTEQNERIQKLEEKVNPSINAISKVS
jgi:hypothetical protein